MQAINISTIENGFIVQIATAPTSLNGQGRQVTIHCPNKEAVLKLIEEQLKTN